MNIELVKLSPVHAQEMFLILSDPRIYEFIPDEIPDSVEALRDRYNRLSVGHAPDDSSIWLNWAINLQGTNQLIGFVQATVPRGGDSAEIAYVLNPRWWGLGLAGQACRAMMLELRESFGILTFRATVDSRNTRSLNLLRRLGFSEKEYKPNAGLIRGVPSDEVVMEKKEI